MSRDKQPGAFALAKWPIILSLVVMLIRLGGELMKLDVWIAEKWNLFSREAGGSGSPLGMSWLILAFGFVFGWRLTGQRDAPDRPGLAFLLCAGALVLVMSAVIVSSQVLELSGFALMGTVLVAALISIALGYKAWPAHARACLALAFPTRLVVVGLTFLLVYLDVDTHFAKVSPDMKNPPTQKLDLAIGLSFAQVTFWPAVTVAVGGMFGVIASAVRGRRKDDRPDHA